MNTARITSLALSLTLLGFSQAALAAPPSEEHDGHFVGKPPIQHVPAEGSLRLGQGTKASDAPRDIESALTVQQSVDLAFSFHPEIGADKALVDASVDNAKSEESGLLPSLRADAEANVDALYLGPSSPKLSGRFVSVEATQPVFDGFQAANRVHAARAESAATEWEYRTNAQEVGLAAVRAYLSVLRERQVMAAALRNLDEHRRALGRIAQAVRFDPGKEFDMQQIRAREAYAASLVAEREGPLHTAVAQFRETTGRLPGGLTPVAYGPNGKGFNSLQEALALAMKVNPSIEVARNRFARRTFERQQAEGALVPHVDLDGRLVKGVDRADVLGQNDEAYFGVRASYVFPLGGGLLKQNDNASDIERNAAYRVDAAERDVRENVRVAWAQRASIISTIEHARQHFEYSAQVLDGYRSQYTLGRRTILDLLIIQNETYQAEARLLGLKFDRIIADYNLAAQIGILDRFVKLPETKWAP